MSRIDFEALAAALKQARIDAITTRSKADDIGYAQWRDDVAAVAAVLRADNPRFDLHRFLKASGAEV